MNEQPDLFDDAPNQGAPGGAALVIPFPLNRDVARVRRTAALYLAKKTDKQRDGYWRNSICRPVTATMRRNGFDDDTIRAQLDAFGAAVSLEIQRLQHGERKSQ